MEALQCRVSALVGTAKRGPWALSPYGEVWVGRSEGSGLRLREAWVPRALARFVPMQLGWLVQNGSRARMRVQNDYLGDALTAPGSLVALQAGRSKLSWPELDDTCQLGLVIGEGVAEGLPELENGRPADSSTVGTDYAVHHVEIKPAVRETMAVVFAHLLTGEPKPANLALAASKRLGRSEQAIKNVTKALRDQINEERWLNLQTLDQLGHYLIGTTRTLSQDDLPER